MNDKIILSATVTFLLFSFLFLAVVERKQADLNQKNKWMLYFEKPQENSLDFTIANHSNQNNFHWIISVDDIKAREGNLQMKNGETKTVLVSLANTQNKRITILVTADEESREIYKTITAK